ncbi:hypothetical protein [uncultured Methylobacterium sp.]|jgi:hypothetical protein|uniref:hypothetical protein n=1 Tax=uncultured Methylobacterium sp. TaxID=157278 RepID=UPI00263757A5|nr:hypothetical protein [uncultured Methylobacterium sp.]
MTIRTMILGLAAGMLAAGAALAADPGPLAFAPDAPLAAPPARVVAGPVCACRVAPRRVVRVAPRRRVAAVWRRPRVIVEAPAPEAGGPSPRSIDFGYSAVGYAYGGGFASATAPFPGAPRGHAAPQRSTWGPAWGPYNTDTVPAYGVGWF